MLAVYQLEKLEGNLSEPLYKEKKLCLPQLELVHCHDEETSDQLHQYECLLGNLKRH